MTGICFVDCETAGLHPDKHPIWEVALITPNGDEHVWQFPIAEIDADPFALQVGRYWERHWSTDVHEIGDWEAIYEAHTAKSRRKNYPEEGRSRRADEKWCRYFQLLTADCYLAGAVVSFDEERLRRLLWSRGVLHRWDYHIIDVEALAAGYLAARGGIHRGSEDQEMQETGAAMCDVATPPWNSNDLSRAVGVNPDDFDRHTALGDCRWARAIYEAVMG